LCCAAGDVNCAADYTKQLLLPLPLLLLLLPPVF
jgi:hypothetical protein